MLTNYGDDFYVFGGREQLSIVTPGGVHLFNRPMLTGMDVSVERNLVDVSCPTDHGPVYLSGNPCHEIRLDIVTRGGSWTNNCNLEDFSLAKDLSVRQLLSIVNNKIRERKI
jgi:hypothetical protein